MVVLNEDVMVCYRMTHAYHVVCKTHTHMHARTRAHAHTISSQLPEMLSHYSADLFDLIHRMLAQAADDRPSVQELLRMHFVRQHIKRFLEKASQRKA